MTNGRKLVAIAGAVALVWLAGCQSGETPHAERRTETYSAISPAGEPSEGSVNSSVQGGAAYTGSTPENVNPVSRTGNGTQTGS